MNTHERIGFYERRKHLEFTNRILAETELAAKTGGFIFDPATQELYWSRGMHRIYETDPDRFIPAPGSAAPFYYVDNILVFRQKTRLLMLTGMEHDVELESVTATGKDLWVHLVCSAETTDGTTTRIIGTLQDVTERKKILQELGESEERFRTLYDNSTIGLYRTTPDGRIILANLVLVKMLGYSSFEELAVRNLEQEGFEPSYDRRQFIEHIETHGEIKDLESNWTRKDGSIILVKESARVFRDPDGRTLYYDGSVEDFTERRRTAEALRQSNENLQLLSDHLNTVRENERMAIAREVHDELGQVFTALKMELMALLRTTWSHTQEVSPKAYSIMEMIEYGIRSVQHISSSLRPRLLDDLGLVSAIEWQAEEFQKRTKIPVILNFPQEDVTIPAEVSTAVFRIVQESLTNIWRHAGATTIGIDLRLGVDDLIFAIRDNGKGITEAQLTGKDSFGLIGIRERVRMLGGEVEFINNHDGGMGIHATIPLRKPGPVQ
jgi:PAS domain S-box-containing protein